MARDTTARTGRPGHPPHAAAFAVSLTPFTADGALDTDALAAHLRRLGDGGVGVYLAGSGSGEGYTLTRAERRRVLETGLAELSGRVPVRLMGVEPRTADQMREMLVDAAEVGVDAAQVYSLDMGHGYRPREAEAERYLRDVLEDAPLPVILSIHQSLGYRYGIDLLDQVMREAPALVGLNVTTPDIGYLADVIAVAEGRATVHVGGPAHVLTAMALGADGYLCSEANIAPRLAAEVTSAVAEGDLDRAHHAYRAVLRLHRSTQRLGGIVGTKAALGALGMPAGSPRPPRAPVPPDDAASLVEVIRELDLVATEGLSDR